MIQIIRTSKMKGYIEKKAKKLYGEQRAIDKKEYSEELRNISAIHAAEKLVLLREIKSITKERNDAVNRTNNFYATFGEIPTRLLKAWRNIARFKKIESDSKIEQLQISAVIEQGLEQIEILKNQADIEIAQIVAINKTVQIGMDENISEINIKDAKLCTE